MFEKNILENGIRVIKYKMPEMKSVSVGIWIEAGSRCETSDNNGVSHFIEHMLFKGTKKRSAKKIAEIFDSIGGQINAFTSKECTCFYTKTLASYLEISLDVLADMFLNSVFDDEEIELERGVILEEIDMYEDAPEEMVHDMITEITWKDSLGYPILGPKDNVKRMNREKIIKYMANNYTLNRVVLSIAGNFDEKEANRLVKKYFSKRERSLSDTEYKKSDFNTGNKIKVKQTEQMNMCIAYPEFNAKSELIYPGLAISNILGGGMSSRLFQEVREKRGLAYSVYSYTSSYMKEGIFVIYVGCNPENTTHVEQLINKEIEKISKKGITNKELKSAKEQLKGNFLLGLENTTSIMTYGGKSELLWSEIETIDEVLKKIDGINEENMTNAMQKIFYRKSPAIAKIGGKVGIDG